MNPDIRKKIEDAAEAAHVTSSACSASFTAGAEFGYGLASGELKQVVSQWQSAAIEWGKERIAKLRAALEKLHDKVERYATSGSIEGYSNENGLGDVMDEVSEALEADNCICGEINARHCQVHQADKGE